MRKPISNRNILVGLIYIALNLIVLGLIAFMLFLFSGCNNSADSREKVTTEKIMMMVGWNTDGDSVIVQHLDSNGDWQKVFVSLNQIDTVLLPYEGNMYRLKVFKDQDSAYSKVIYVK